MFLSLIFFGVSLFLFYDKDVISAIICLLLSIVLVFSFFMLTSISNECKELNGVLVQEYCIDKKYTIPLNHQK